jgi:hypothetical protein
MVTGMGQPPSRVVAQVVEGAVVVAVAFMFAAILVLTAMLV